MRRITISLPEDIAQALADEAHRRHGSVSELVREAVARRLGMDGGGHTRDLPFASLGSSGHRDTSVNADAILAKAWTDDDNRNR